MASIIVAFVFSQRIFQRSFSTFTLTSHTPFFTFANNRHFPVFSGISFRMFKNKKKERKRISSKNFDNSERFYGGIDRYSQPINCRIY